MDKEIFVARLKTLAPSKEDLKKRGLSDDFINSFIQSYYCNKKTDFNLNFFSNDTILKLLQYYDCSKVEIGIITFTSKIIEEVGYYHIGNAEQDILSLNKTFLSIEILDYVNPTHVLWECASSSENFLESMLLCADFFTSRITDSSLLDNDAYTLERVNMCTEIAGGNKYRDFYKMLLGYFD